MAKKEAKKVETRQYEGMFLLPAGATAEMEKSLALVKGMVERHHGSVLVLKKWDERKLAYELKKQKRGLYIICYFQAPPEAIAQIERDVNLSEDCLRVLITDAAHLNKDEMNAVEPQPIIKEEKPAWDRPYEMREFDRSDRGPRSDRAPRADREPAGAAKE